MTHRWLCLPHQVAELLSLSHGVPSHQSEQAEPEMQLGLESETRQLSLSCVHGLSQLAWLHVWSIGAF